MATFGYNPPPPSSLGVTARTATPPAVASLSGSLSESVALTEEELRRELLARRVEAGHWEGRLSSSALATATAVLALWIKQTADGGCRLDPPIRGGLRWLVQNQNPDGGWGDTVRSKSHLATTSLVWAALSLADARRHYAASLGAAQEWLEQRVGPLAPQSLGRAIVAYYGKDRTFSAPILTVLALAGRLGSGSGAWRHVPQLPFELASCPPSWFRWLRLRVVSYALPALIAIGQVRHHHRPTRNPLTLVLRRLTRRRTLEVLQGLQPKSGGFLEATPLTAFVVMSLAASGQPSHPVVNRGLGFLVGQARSDGSWPIDGNLATWVTTLSVKALAAAGAPHDLVAGERRRLRDWLLGQQYREEHPFTGAAPGGWAWTDLPGGVPDADDTAGALLALHCLAPEMDGSAPGTAVQGSVEAGVRWLLDLQNRDGGMPTFCRGWGRLPFDRSGADLTAHALWAWALWLPRLPDGLRLRVVRAVRRGVLYLARHRRRDGSWLPLWFGHQDAPDEANPAYATAHVLLALVHLAVVQRETCLTLPRRLLRDLIRDARRWLLAAQNPDGGWGGAPGVRSSLEETGLALRALTAVHESDASPAARCDPSAVVDARPTEVAMTRGAAWIVDQIGRGRKTAAPIGLYFSRLWYFEELYPLIYAVAGLAAYGAHEAPVARESAALEAGLA